MKKNTSFPAVVGGESTIKGPLFMDPLPTTAGDDNTGRSMEIDLRPAPLWLHVCTVVLAFATFLLVIAGGLVTSTGSALAVPDWPLAFGKFFPPMVGGVLFEHGHRMIAATIGFLTILLSIAFCRTRSHRVLRILSLWAVGAVILQGLLGGITVLLRLPLFVSVSHACLGQTFFCIVVSLALLSRERTLSEPARPFAQTAKIQRLAVMTTGFIFLQLIAGAVLRHSGMGLHLHLLGAFLVAVHVILLGRRILFSSELSSVLRRPAILLLTLTGVQVLLGIHAWRLPSVAVNTSHVANGALILATSVVISLQSYLRWLPA